MKRVPYLKKEPPRIAVEARRESLDELFVRLETSERGISSIDVQRRLQKYGTNEVSALSGRSRLREFTRTALNPLIIILLIAAMASAFLGQTVDAIIIASMVLISGILNFWQTYRSERAASRLRDTIAPTATVCRDGQWQELPRGALVPGDVIRVSAGDLVPADVRLVEASDLHVQQSALTGESLPAEKFATKDLLTVLGPGSPSLAFLGTSVVSGSGVAVVFATGKGTSFGDIVERLAERPEETEFERGMRRFGLLILHTVVFLVFFVLVINISVGRDALQSLLFSVALAVGLTPEFMPMITTVTLARGAVRMARENVIVKHLSSIQNLGSIDILCSDKTGTLTAGSMSLNSGLDPLGRPSERAILLAKLNSKFETGIKSPFDIAILKSSKEQPDHFEKTDEVPFDFERRRLSVVVDRFGEYTLITKGAPESVCGICSFYEIDGEVRPLDEGMRERFLEAFRAQSRLGFRVLGVAYRKVSAPNGFTVADERNLILAGFVTFSDQLLEGVSDSISALGRDGVHVKILTGDDELVTRHICKQAGVDPGRIVLGKEVESLDEIGLGTLAETASVFVRLSPAQKHRIIRALKARGHVVGFLGDGINDAPSLHAADVGISVAGAVDIAREASDIILLKRRLDVLHGGIIAGRESFGNVFKYLLMGTSSNFGNMFSMAAAALFLPFLPMLPVQILMNNFLYDFAQITIPTDNIDPAYIKSPQRWNIRVIRNFMLVIGPISSLYDFLTFFVLLHVFHFGERLFHTGWFVESLATQALVLFVIRTVGRPWSSRPSVLLTTTTLAVVFLGAVFPFTSWAAIFGFSPLPWKFFLYLFVAVATYLVVVELVKRRVMRHILRRSVRTS